MQTLFWLLIIKIGHFGFKNLYFTLLRYEKNNQRKLSPKSIWMNRESKTLPKILNILIQLSMRFVALFWNQKFSIFLRRKITFRISIPGCFFWRTSSFSMQSNLHNNPYVSRKKKYEHASDEMINLCIASYLFGLATEMTKKSFKDPAINFYRLRKFCNNESNGHRIFFFIVINDHIDADFMIPITEKSCICFK